MAKKIFLIWADNGPEIVNLIKKLEEQSHKIIYWVGLGKNTSPNKGIIFHDHYSAW